MLRRWLLWLVVVVFVWVVFSRLADLEGLVDTLLQGRWPWVLAAAVLQVVYYLFLAVLYQVSLRAVDIASRARDLLAVLLASLFVNVIAPSGGMAGTALFVDDAARRGQPAARVATGVLLARIADSVGFAVWLLVGLAYLFLNRDLKPYQIAGAGGLVVSIVGLVGLLVLGLSRPVYLRRLLDGFARALNRLMVGIGRPAPLANDWAERQAAEFAQAGVAIGERPRRLLRVLGIAFTGHLVNLLSLFALFLAFRRPIGFGPVIAGYATGILFWKMSPVPEGVGVVEGVMVLAFRSVGVPAPVATVVTLAFRGLTFWLPLLAGVFALRRLAFFRPSQAARRGA